MPNVERRIPNVDYRLLNTEHLAPRGITRYLTTLTVMRHSMILFLLMPWPLSAEEPFNPKQVVRPFPAIVEPDVVGVGAAGKFVRNDELVLGVVVGGAARAYPINMIVNPTREIINDRLGGRSIAATL